MILSFARDTVQSLHPDIPVYGSMSVITWALGTRAAIKAEALTKLNAAKGGGMIFQSDHSVPSKVSGENYEYVVNLVREYGKYPLKLGEYDLANVKEGVIYEACGRTTRGMAPVATSLQLDHCLSPLPQLPTSEIHIKKENCPAL
jgi:hypothetical protein